MSVTHLIRLDPETLLRVQFAFVIVSALIIVAMQMLIMVALIRHSRTHEELHRQAEQAHQWDDEHRQIHEQMADQVRNLRPMVFHTQEHGRDAPKQQ